MPRRQAQGWVWDRKRVRELARYIRLNLTCGKIAERFNARYAARFPLGLSLTKNAVLKGIRSKTVGLLLVELYGDEEMNRLVAQLCRPRGRPKGAKDKQPRKPGRWRRVSRSVAPSRAVSASDLMAFRVQTKTPAQ